MAPLLNEHFFVHLFDFSLPKLLLGGSNSSLGLLLDDFLEVIPLNIHRVVVTSGLRLGTGRLLLLIIIVHILLVLVTRENHRNKWRAGIHCSMRR